jgi:hypothetical protein
MQTWYDTRMKMQDAYVHEIPQPKLKKEKPHQAHPSNVQITTRKPPFSYVIVATHPESVSMSVHKDAF